MHLFSFFHYIVFHDVILFVLDMFYCSGVRNKGDDDDDVRDWAGLS